MNAKKESEKIFDKVVDFRRHIHANPELSFKEHDTQAYIAQRLNDEKIPFVKIADTGILARIEGNNPQSRATVLRADIDALPIHEATALPFKSTHDGVMHACGHDMHAATLFGALSILNSHRDEIEGTLFGLFQPAEELNPGGASLVLKEKPFAAFKEVRCIASHIDPELPTGVFGLREGKYMASSDELRFTVHGTGGHGAMRKNIKDPIIAAAEYILALHTLPSRAIDKSVPTVLSIGRVIADGATNVIPDTVYMEGTLRVFDETWRKDAKEFIIRSAKDISLDNDVNIEVNISAGYPSVVNNSVLTNHAEELLAQTFGSNAVRHLDLRPTADDFGSFTQIYPSLLFRVGTGGNALLSAECAESAGKLHTRTLRPNENALKYSVAAFVLLATNI